MAWRENVNN